MLWKRLLLDGKSDPSPISTGNFEAYVHDLTSVTSIAHNIDNWHVSVDWPNLSPCCQIGKYHADERDGG